MYNRVCRELPHRAVRIVKLDLWQVVLFVLIHFGSRWMPIVVSIIERNSATVFATRCLLLA